MTPAFDTTSPDPFFILRDARGLLESRLDELARRAAVGDSKLVSAFVGAFGEAHDALANDRQRDGFDSAQGLTASRMTLMCDADLELDIRIGDLVRRVAERCANSLWRAHQRYVTLLRRPEMGPDASPVGQEALSAALWALCNATDENLERKMAMLERIEQVLGGELVVVYDELNELLASRGIEPAQPVAVSSRQEGTGASDAAARATAANPVAALQQALGQQAGLGTALSQSGGDGGPAINAATLVMLNQLNARLEQLEAAAESSTATIPHALTASDLGLPAGRPEGVALDTLGQIFESIFAIWDIPDTVKTAIGRLQIPMLRLAISDAGLFADPKHPARRLINAMGRAAVGLPRDLARAHPISTQLWKIAGSVAETLKDDAGVLSGPIGELEALIAQRDAAVVGAAAPFVAHLAEREASVAGASAAQQWLIASAAQPTAIEFHAFFRDFWVRVMAAAAHEGGEQGPAWQEAASTAADLRWSIEPKADADERKRLAAMVPGLIRRLNAGLDRIGISAEERKPFLDACFNLQTAGLRGASPQLLTFPAETLGTPVAPLVPAANSETVGGRSLRWMVNDEALSGAYRGNVGVRIGQWLQLASEGGDPQTGLVAWIGARYPIALLLNPDIELALLVDAATIEAARRDGRLEDLSTRNIFDVAVDAALQRVSRGGA